MFEEIFEGDPIEKWKEIILHAHSRAVYDELDHLLTEWARFELQKDGVEESLDNLNAKKRDLAIQSMASILSQND